MEYGNVSYSMYVYICYTSMYLVLRRRKIRVIRVLSPLHGGADGPGTRHIGLYNREWRRRLHKKAKYTHVHTESPFACMYVYLYLECISRCDTRVTFYFVKC